MLFEDHPVISTPTGYKEKRAKMSKKPTAGSAITLTAPRGNKAPSMNGGATTKAKKPILKGNLSAFSGTISSLEKNFKNSATFCNNPNFHVLLPKGQEKKCPQLKSIKTGPLPVQALPDATFLSNKINRIVLTMRNTRMVVISNESKINDLIGPTCPSGTIFQ